MKALRIGDFCFRDCLSYHNQFTNTNKHKQQQQQQQGDEEEMDEVMGVMIDANYDL